MRKLKFSQPNVSIASVYICENKEGIGWFICIKSMLSCHVLAGGCHHFADLGKYLKGLAADENTVLECVRISAGSSTLHGMNILPEVNYKIRGTHQLKAILLMLLSLELEMDFARNNIFYIEMSTA